MLLASAGVLWACSGPTEAGNPADTITLQISAPPSVLVHEQALLAVRAVNRSGDEVALPQPAAWSSSDPTVVTVTSAGVVRALRRGDAAITVTAGSARATVPLRAMARVRVAPEGIPAWAEQWSLAVGDSLQLAANYVDVNGLPISDTPTATWISSNPAAVRVSPSGIVVGAQPLSFAWITASTEDGLDSLHVGVSDAIAGQPATVRFAHAVPGAAPLTFLPSKGGPVTVSFGESVERTIGSGMLFVEMQGFPPTAHPWKQTVATMIRGGDHLSLYAVSGTGFASLPPMFLTEVWTSVASVPPDSGLARFVQGSGFNVVYLRPPDAPMSGLPEFCYFDPGDPSGYFRLAAGDFDIILQGKYAPPPSRELGRLRASLAGGRAVTYVLIGDTPQTAAVLAFPDP